jgi:hypothetical protein
MKERKREAKATRKGRRVKKSGAGMIVSYKSIAAQHWGAQIEVKAGRIQTTMKSFRAGRSKRRFKSRQQVQGRS